MSKNFLSFPDKIRNLHPDMTDDIDHSSADVSFVTMGYKYVRGVWVSAVGDVEVVFYGGKTKILEATTVGVFLETFLIIGINTAGTDATVKCGLE